MAIPAIRAFVRDYPSSLTYAKYGAAGLSFYTAYTARKIFPVSAVILTALSLFFLYYRSPSAPREAIFSKKNSLNSASKTKASSPEVPLKDPISQEVIPKEYLIYLGQTPFDARSLFLSLINSQRCLNPVTNEQVSDQELKPLCDKFGLQVTEFRGFWKRAEADATTFILQESTPLLPWRSVEEAQEKYLVEHDEEIRNHQRTFRQQKALELIGFRNPLLAVDVAKQLE